MTNFEKWKQGLNELDVLNFVGRKHLRCQHCPAIEFCKSKEDVPCYYCFMEWASTEAEAEPPKEKF